MLSNFLLFQFCIVWNWIWLSRFAFLHLDTVTSSQKLNGSVAAMGVTVVQHHTVPGVQVGQPGKGSRGATWGQAGKTQTREEHEAAPSSEEGAAQAWAEWRCVASVATQTTTGRCWIEKRGPILQGLLGQGRDSFAAVYFHWFHPIDWILLFVKNLLFKLIIWASTKA